MNNFVIVNHKNLFLMQVDYRQYAFTDNVKLAIKFIDEGNANLKIKLLPMYTGLSVKRIFVSQKKDQ